MKFDDMFIGQDNMVYGRYLSLTKKKDIVLFDKIYINEIGIDVVTGEQIVNIVMERFGNVYEQDMPLKDAKAENIINRFRGYGFRCTNQGVSVLDEWMMYYGTQGATTFYCYEKIGYLNTKNDGIQYCYPDVVKAEYIGEKDYTAQGSGKKWLNLIQYLHSQNSMIALPLAIGLSAPVVSRLRYLVGKENLLVSFSGLTSTGKSTTLSLMASMWGKPSIGADGILDNLNTTLNALQSKLNNVQGCPVFLDETSSNKNIDYQQMVYELADGLSKARANSQGDVREQSTWNTTIILTTEGSLVNSLETAGSKARLLDIPIKFYNSKEDAESVKSLVPFCYGHIAKRFLKKLNKMDDQGLLSLYQKASARLKKKFHGDFPQEYYRMLDRIALVDVAAQVLQEMKIFHFISQSDFDKAYGVLAENYQHTIMDEDESLKEKLINKVIAHIRCFHRVKFPESRYIEDGSIGDCYGKIIHTGGRYVAYIMTDIVEDWLQLTKAEARNIFARWKQKQILVKCDDGRTQCRTSIQGRKLYTYVIEIEGDASKNLVSSSSMVKRNLGEQPSSMLEK